MELLVRSKADVERHFALVHAAAAKTQAWIADHEGEPLQLLRSLKFEAVGSHPVAHHALNVIEQINQTFTYAVALSAADLLLELHPDVGGFILAPGAHMSRELDIMSVQSGIVGAETFAAVDPRNNGKLAKDLEKLASRKEIYRYVFFGSPTYAGAARRHALEKYGIEVWSVDA